MRIIKLNIVLLTALLIASCKIARSQNSIDLKVTGSIEVTEYEVEKTEEKNCSVHGKFVHNKEYSIVGITIHCKDSTIRTVSDIDRNFDIKGIPPGSYTLIFEYENAKKSTLQLNLSSGDHVTLKVIIEPSKFIDLERPIQVLKPIIYLYPEEQIEVHLQLEYDGELTTTYPIYTENGWSVQAHPDGTLFDEKGREYYSLFWEGTPRKPLGIPDGFVISKEETIPFLEEKLELLGLNPKEANEFIIFWLPILEKNNYNVIHFAGDDYLQQAQLTITPQPKTMIRVAMIFQGADEPIDIPTQNLTPLMKIRKGFTLVEWGGQELPKMSAKGI